MKDDWELEERRPRRAPVRIIALILGLTLVSVAGILLMGSGGEENAAPPGPGGNGENGTPPGPSNLPPTASFSILPEYPFFLVGEEIQFTDTSTDQDGDILEWSWSFGDGENSSEQNPTHAYSGEGTYTVTLTVTDSEGETDTSSATVEVVPPSIVRVEQADGGHVLTVNGEPFVVRGIAYSPTPVGRDVNSGYNWWSDQETYTNDFPMIHQMGANTIRTYGSIGATRSAMDNAYLENIYVIMGYWVNPHLNLSSESIRQNLVDGFVSVVRKWKNHPAVLMWSFGNEVEQNYGGNVEDWYTLLQEAAQAAHEEEGENYHPVTTAHSDIAGSKLGDPSVKADDASMSALDLWGINSYRGPTFTGLFSEYASKSSKPFILVEWGADAWDGRTSIEDQSTQSEYIRTQWLDIEKNLGPSGPCLGGTVFEWSDEWWKAGSPSEHTTSAQWQNGAYADPNMNEEWWGITEITPGSYVKTPRQAYETLKELWTTAESDFGISVSPSGTVVEAGTSTQATISVSERGTYTNTVELEVSSPSTGITVSLSIQEGTPSFDSVMTINVGSAVASGDYEIIITGRGAEGRTRSTTYSLTVISGGVEPYTVYSDSGIPLGSTLYTWPYPATGDSWDGEYAGENPPEGSTCFRTDSTDWAGWGVWVTGTVDLSAHGSLKFWVKTPMNLKIEIEAPEGYKQTRYISSFGWDGIDTWQEIVIPASSFANLDQVHYLFMVTGESTGTFYVDHVRWV